MESEFKSALHTFVKNRKTAVIALAKVTKVESETIDVVTINDDEIYDVRLQSTIDGSTEGVILKPAIGTWVVIADIGDAAQDYVVIAYERLQSATVKIGGTVFELTTEGVSIKRGAEDFKGVLDDLFTQLTTSFTAINAVVPIANLPQYTLLKNRFGLILK